MKDLLFVLPLSTSLPEFKQRICDTLQFVKCETLQPIWQELAYCNDIIPVTKGIHIKHL